MSNPTKFKSLVEVRQYLDNFSKQLREEEQLLDDNVKQLARVSAKAVKAAEELDFSGTPGARRKKTLNVDFPMVKVPNADVLKKNYAVAEKLSEQYKYLLTLSNEVKLNFKGVKGPALDKTLGAILKLRQDIEIQLKKLFHALGQVAEGHAPKEFKEFVTHLAKEIHDNKHVNCDAVKTISYAALDAEKKLVFAGYIILSNCESDEGKVAPHLYIAVKWTVGGNVEIFVEHEFVAPTLLKGGEVVVNIHEAAKAVANQLTMEGFSTQVGNLPAEMLLKIPKEGLSKDLFSIAEHLQTVTAKEDELIFVFKPTTKANELEEMSLQLFQEVKSMLKKKKATRVRMKTVGKTVLFTFVGLDQSEGISITDLDWIQQKYKISDTQLRKIVNTIDSGE
jgi:hypothetical protein